jgi:PAS domain S-box-containing protein
MVQSCLEGVWVIGADRLLTFVNPQLAAMLGYEPHEMIGRSPLDFIAPAAHEDARRRFQHRRQGIAGRWQVPMRHQDGREVWTIAASSPMFDDEGEFAGVVGFLTDVSERRALEQKVQQAQKLESLGLLAGGLAHDFNNLLVGILGNASLAREELPASSPVAPLLDDIETAGKRAAELTRQMLAYAGKAERRVERLELNQLVRDTLPLVSGVVSRKATLALELSPELLHVSGDVTQLRQILMNLLTNASDALVDGVGRIVVRTGALRLTRSDLDAVSIDHTLDGDAHAFVEVSDDGCGMNPATQARIFDPFFTTKFTGRGLGLAAVLGILRAHGGGISVDSSPGRGSRFRVLLPRVDGDAASTAPPALAATAEGTAPRPIAGGRVLVVDDETAVLQLAVRALERVGYSVDAAKDGAEALARFAERSHEYDAIVLDLTMPGLQGNEVLAGLRARRADVPVVITSGFDELDVRHRFGGDARSWFLAKPWTVGTLVDAVARAIGGRAG